MKRLLISTFAALLLAAPINIHAKTINWGIYHEIPGEIPEGNTTNEYLKEFDACFHAESDGEKVLYLTFDTGYEDGNMTKILDILRDENVPAAFFLLGTYIKTNPELVLRMVNEGHAVCNHTMTHPDMTKKGAEGFAKELTQAEDVYRELTGQEMPKYYRPPQGIFNETNLKQAKEMGYKTVLWSIAYSDWIRGNQPPHAQSLKTLISRLHPGAIILLHTTSTTNAAILDDFIIRARELGYDFKPLSDIFTPAEEKPPLEF